MGMGKYILDEREQPVEEPDVVTWGLWFSNIDNRRVAEDRFGDIRVSTVFIGLDHRFDDDGPPLLWETMIFGGTHAEYCERYSTADDARDGHEKACELVLAQRKEHQCD